MGRHLIVPRQASHARELGRLGPGLKSLVGELGLIQGVEWVGPILRSGLSFGLDLMK